MDNKLSQKARENQLNPPNHNHIRKNLKQRFSIYENKKIVCMMHMCVYRDNIEKI